MDFFAFAIVSAFLLGLISDVLLIFQDLFRKYDVTLLAMRVIICLTLIAMEEANKHINGKLADYTRNGLRVLSWIYV